MNPLDAWGTGNDFEEIFLGVHARRCSTTPTPRLSRSSSTSPARTSRWATQTVAEQIFHQTDKPFAVVSNLAAAIDPRGGERLRAAGVPVLEDTYQRPARLQASSRLPRSPSSSACRRRPSRFGDRRASAGSPAARRRLCVWTNRKHSSCSAPTASRRLRPVWPTGLDMALDAADEFGYPVVLKVTGLDHKSDVGGVRTGLDDEQALIAAHRALSESFGARR